MVEKKRGQNFVISTTDFRREFFGFFFFSFSLHELPPYSSLNLFSPPFMEEYIDIWFKDSKKH